MSYSYHKLLKFLYFEGYADSYEEAEHLLEEMSDEEFDIVEGLSRLPKGSLEEVSDSYLERSARASMERAQQSEREKKEMQKQLASRARAQQTRSGDTISMPGTHKGEKGTIVYNKITKQRTFIPDKS
jgi:hypothetical protein